MAIVSPSFGVVCMVGVLSVIGGVSGAFSLQPVKTRAVVRVSKKSVVNFLMVYLD